MARKRAWPLEDDGAYVLGSGIDSSLAWNIESKGRSQLYGNQMKQAGYKASRLLCPGNPFFFFFFFNCDKIYAT